MNETKTLQAGIVRVKLIGVLGSAAGCREIGFTVSEPSTVAELLTLLTKKVDNRQFRDLLIDSTTGDPRPNVIILLGDQDCNLFEGLKTKVRNGDVVTIIPVAHGGTD